MKCKFCNATIEEGSLICSYCGQRNPLEILAHKNPVSTPNYSCVECHSDTMRYRDIGTIEELFLIAECGQCRGQFIPKAMLERIILYYGWKRKKTPSKIHQLEKKKNSLEAFYRCPECNGVMKRYTFKVASQVVVDECPRHGFWLNDGELYALIAWKRELKESKDTQKEEELYKKYGLKKRESSYKVQSNYASSLDRFFEWLMGV